MSHLTIIIVMVTLITLMTISVSVLLFCNENEGGCDFLNYVGFRKMNDGWLNKNIKDVGISTAELM